MEKRPPVIIDCEIECDGCEYHIEEIHRECMFDTNLVRYSFELMWVSYKIVTIFLGTLILIGSIYLLIFGLPAEFIDMMDDLARALEFYQEYHGISGD